MYDLAYVLFLVGWEVSVSFVELSGCHNAPALVDHLLNIFYFMRSIRARYPFECQSS